VRCQNLLKPAYGDASKCMGKPETVERLFHTPEESRKLHEGDKYLLPETEKIC